ncbi:di-heme oxidoredictase family protein [Janthinobacterium lividum]|uniref:di-heme oxidoredictase family protein n=1 Tax=Janthinobacterium lividum TaxID=29581 RepID=UPI00068962BC|nr:di-heme oxidoredictase family protein [Janthinobacterium lividum]
MDAASWPNVRYKIAIWLLGLLAVFTWRLLPAAYAEAEAWQVAAALGGSTTTYAFGSQAYTRAAPFLTLAQRAQFSRGSVLFNQPREDFVTTSLIGQQAIVLHTQFNAHSCVQCHVRDGRSLTQVGDEPQGPLVARLGYQDGRETRVSLQSTNSAQTSDITLDWRYIVGSYADGTTYTLRAPVVSIKGTKGGTPSVRAAPAVYGLGLLEAIDEATLQHLEARRAHSSLGIVGQLRWIEDGSGRRHIGRFGWKADVTNLRSQVHAALDEELGVKIIKTDKLNPHDTQDIQDLLAYMQLLGVAARAQTREPVIMQGAMLFKKMHCVACHVPALFTGKTHAVAGLRQQLIHPYTDLMLHDMGTGLMSDTSTIGRHWRTPALWGIGLQSQVAAQAGYLHDGRAKNLSEAILWHGGEGEVSRMAFVAAERTERQALLAFLASL